MSYSYLNLSPTNEAGCRLSAATASVAPSENVWLDFDSAPDRKRAELEAALRRLLGEDSGGDSRP